MISPTPWRWTHAEGHEGGQDKDLLVDANGRPVAKPVSGWDQTDLGIRVGNPENADVIEAAGDMFLALTAVLECDPDPCHFDHHGTCQAHNMRRNAAGEPECQLKLVREAFSKATKSQRNNKETS